MATSFNSGFKLGTDMFTQAQRNSLAQEELAMQKERDVLAKERDARAAEEFGWRRDAEARQRTKDSEVDSLTQQLTRPNAENYALAPRGTGMGMRVSNQPAAELPAEGLAMPKFATGATAPGLRMSNQPAAALPAEGLAMPQLDTGVRPVGGLRAPAMTDRPMTFNQAPTGAAAEDLLGRIALTKGDTAAYRTSQASAKNFKYEDGLKAQYAAWDAMTDDDRLKIVDRISLDQGIPGNGTWVAGKGKQPGYMNWTPPGKDPMKFSMKETRDLFALTNLMDVDPIRARAEMDKVSAQVRAIAKDVFDAQTKGVTSNNQATRFANADANDVARTDLLGQELDIKRDVAAFNRSRLLQKDKLDASATAFQSKVDGVLEGYQAAMTLGPAGKDAAAIYAREYDQLRATAPKGLRIPPSIRALNDAQKSAGPSKPVEVPEQGKIMMRDGKRYMTDGLGGEIEVNARGKALGVMPADRDNFVTKTLGMPPAMANELEYSKDGRYILAPNGAEYDTQDPKDMKRIKDDVLAFAAQDPDEYERRMLGSRYPAPTGFGPRITARPAEGAPSIYAGPEEWAAYRARQQQQ